VECISLSDASSEDTVVHEFAALCLASLAQDFSCKVSILEQDGLEPLIRCLSSVDPDVQKNAVETISLMLKVNRIFLIFVNKIYLDFDLGLPNQVIIERT
jgi:hypothetical protein